MDKVFVLQVVEYSGSKVVDQALLGATDDLEYAKEWSQEVLDNQIYQPNISQYRFEISDNFDRVKSLTDSYTIKAISETSVYPMIKYEVNIIPIGVLQIENK